MAKNINTPTQENSIKPRNAALHQEVVAIAMDARQIRVNAQTEIRQGIQGILKSQNCKRR